MPQHRTTSAPNALSLTDRLVLNLISLGIPVFVYSMHWNLPLAIAIGAASAVTFALLRRLRHR